jgi:hypothetical protein
MQKQGLIQAASVTLYCTIIGALVFQLSDSHGGTFSFLLPVAFLLLFSASALICGLLVFYKPYLLFFKNKKKEAIDLVLHTAMWLFVFFVTALLAALLIR